MGTLIEKNEMNLAALTHQRLTVSRKYITQTLNDKDQGMKTSLYKMIKLSWNRHVEDNGICWDDFGAFFVHYQI